MQCAHALTLTGVQGPIIKVKYEPNMKEAIGMVAGGTGITPMLQARGRHPVPPSLNLCLGAA